MSRLDLTPILVIAVSSASAQSLFQQYGEIIQGSNEAVSALPGVTIAPSGAHSVPAIDLNGNVVWRATIAGAGITTANDYALFYGRNGNDLTLLYQEGDAEPTGTLPGVNLVGSTSWDRHHLSPENGFLVWNSSLAGTGITTANDTCIFWGQIGSAPQILFQEGVTAAPTGGAIATGSASSAFGQTQVGSSGTTVIKVRFAGGDVGTFNGISTWGDDALVVGLPGNLSWCCREGDPINGGQQAVGSLTSFGTAASVQVDVAGRVLFPQALSTTEGLSPASASNDSTLMLFTPGAGLSLLIREGDLAADTNPPLAEGNLYGTLTMGKVALSRQSGRVVFMSNMTGGTVTGPSNDIGIFAGSIGGAFTRIAREGEAAPTGVPGETYGAFFPSSAPSINDNGTVVFIAQLGNAASIYSDVAVFRAVPPYGPTDVSVIVREDDPALGLPAGWTIGNTNGGGMGSSSTATMLNDREDVLVHVAGVGDSTQTNWGVPATIGWDPEHGARAFYVEGDDKIVNGASWVTTSAAGFNNNFSSGDGGQVQFNNNGDVCMKLFSGSANAIARGHIGALIAEPASVPAAGGVPHGLHLDCGPGHQSELYLILASSSGTRPGFVNPLNLSQTVSLNLDSWVNASLTLNNSVVWQNTFGITDSNGAATASFQLPAGLPGAIGLKLHHAAVLFDLSLVGTFVTEPSMVRLY